MPYIFSTKSYVLRVHYIIIQQPLLEYYENVSCVVYYQTNPIGLWYNLDTPGMVFGSGALYNLTGTVHRPIICHDTKKTHAISIIIGDQMCVSELKAYTFLKHSVSK